MIIFSPGPANISERVRKALARPDICHRDTEFMDVLTDARKDLLSIASVASGYESIILGGSGTSAIESVIASFGGYDRKILIVSNGVYGERAAAIALRFNINFEEIRLGWGEFPDLNLIESKLKNNDFGAVYIVHHETTTGIINPLREVCRIAKGYGVLVLTDAISSIGGEMLDIEGWSVDAVIGSANKCIRGIAGISFVIASSRFMETITNYKSRSFYTDLSLHYAFERKGQTPFTPPVQVFYAFQEALKELREEGVGERIKKYKHITGTLRDGLKGMGIRFFLPGNLMSNTMTVVYIPQGQSYSLLHSEFKKKGFVIYASQGKLQETTFRLGTVGIITKSDIEKFLKIFRDLL